MIGLNDKCSDGVFHSRNKDYYDQIFIAFVLKVIQNGGARFSIYYWDDRIFPLIPFQYPFYPEFQI